MNTQLCKVIRPLGIFILPVILFQSWTLKKPNDRIADGIASGVVFDNDGLTANGTLISDNWKVTEFEDAFGKADSVFGSKFNATHVYDDLGLLYFERTSTKTSVPCVKEIMFWYGKDNEDSWTHVPKNFCKLKLSFDDYNFAPATTPDALKKAMKGWNQCSCASSHWYKFSNDKVFLFFAFEKTEQHVIWIDAGIRTGTSDCD